jgi:hypothetical protein
MKGQGTLSDGWDKAIEDIHALGAEYMVCAFCCQMNALLRYYKSIAGNV